MARKAMTVYLRTKIRQGSPPYWLGHMDFAEKRISKPVDRRTPLPYYRYRGDSFRSANVSGDGAGPSSVTASLSYALAHGLRRTSIDASNRAYSQAYNRFVNRVKGSETAQLALTVAEARQSLTMINSRVVGLLNAVSSFRRGNLEGGLRHLLGYSYRNFDKRRPRWRSILREGGSDISGIMLELKFGWLPMVNDIANAVETLQRRFPFQRITATGSDYSTHQSFTQIGFDKFSELGSVSVKTVIIADVSVSNPNLYLANTLGFVNPINVAWQLVPFSFVIDWFVPIGKFLANYTDLVGVKTDRLTVTSVHRCTGLQTTETLFDRWTTSSGGWRVKREVIPELSPPTFWGTISSPSSGLDFGKVATLVELLVQQLSNRR